MTLRQLESVSQALGWFAERGVCALSVDSRQVRNGDAFIAWPGYAVDARQFVPQALAAGASACLVEAEGAQAFGAALDAPEVAALAGLKASTGLLASGFLGAPSERLNVIAVTGTNGKTSTAWWVAQSLGALDRRCGVIGTLGVGEPPRVGGGGAAQRQEQTATITFTGMTTPDPVTVQSGLRRFVDAGFEACAIEATSIGIAEQRLNGTRIDVALFTNFTRDHLDYHETMTAYWYAKAKLFEWPGLRSAVINIDDVQGAALAKSLRGIDVWSYSARSAARLRASAVRYAERGLAFVVHEGEASASVETGLIGDYNVSNLLATVGALRASGVALSDAALACRWLTPVPGRMERLPADDAMPQVVVDYAHTPDALEKALQALQPFATERHGALWCVFGCGGNRDATKRPLMGALAQRLAQQVVVTSDNPRDEAPDAIVAQIVAGLGRGREHVQVIEDRRAAIEWALRHAAARDVVLIAGKGHEDYQEIRGVKHPFSDVDEALAALHARAPMLGAGWGEGSSR